MLKLHHKDLVFQPPITTTLSRIHKWKACKTVSILETPFLCLPLLRCNMLNYKTTLKLQSLRMHEAIQIHECYVVILDAYTWVIIM
ncbi:hypothetical protein HanRHA438_Chr00c10g0848101 [Helianthus annuus]|nr:hypothetical protein HanRHA438_Chr00c10g0848101 [Helianthus annuus]